MGLKESLKAFGIGTVRAFILTLLALAVLLAVLNYVVVGYFKPEYSGVFANLLVGTLDNPLILGALAGALRSYFGWLQNFFENGAVEYDATRLAETWTIYMGGIMIFSQGVPTGVALVLTLLSDLIVRAIKS